MNWSTRITPRRNFLPAHLERFSDQLKQLSQEIRSSVAGLTGDAVGHAVRELLVGLCNRSAGTTPRHPTRVQDDDWHIQGDDWRDERWSIDGEAEELVTPSTIPSVLSVPKLALTLQTAGWWLQHGSWLGLLTASVGAGGLALLRKHSKESGSHVIDGISEVASVLLLLHTGIKHLKSN